MGPGPTPATLAGLEYYFSNIISVAIEFGGIILFIMLIIGGFNYLTSNGNPQQAESAKKTITYAIAGIVVLALSFLILKLIYVFTGVDVTQFKISQ
ncbi:MAG: hypothetical protein KatS3mg088_121 [Patescibacteria group bacterium]|nr:MAG: hypothetical protein KatS3mg088_121 [Patescibacteria group bacterium]